MRGKIEDGFRPATVNEVLLLERIHELRIASYENGSFMPVGYDDPKPMMVKRIHPELRLAVDLKAGWESDYRFHINAEARLPDKHSLHYGHYISRELFDKWTPQAAAQELGKMHERAVKAIAATIMQDAHDRR